MGYWVVCERLPGGAGFENVKEQLRFVIYRDQERPLVNMESQWKQKT